MNTDEKDYIALTDFMDSLEHDECFINLDIEKDVGIGYYKTMHIQYKDIKGNEVPYLFPMTFQFVNGKLAVNMVLGSVDKNFIAPININGTYTDSKHYKGTVSLNTISLGFHTYKLLAIEGIGDIFDLKSYQCIIEGLDNIGFPFMRISSNNSINIYTGINTFNEANW